MLVNLLYFGVLKECFGVDRETVEVPAETTVEGILSFSRERTSNSRASELRTQGESGVWNTLAVAVNREYADRTTVLRDGDEVALLPPVSGGCGEKRRTA
jgi:molybdopterin converting factor subunit 1